MKRLESFIVLKFIKFKIEAMIRLDQDLCTADCSALLVRCPEITGLNLVR